MAINDMTFTLRVPGRASHRLCRVLALLLASGCASASRPVISTISVPSEGYARRITKSLEAYQAGRIDEALAAVRAARAEHPDEPTTYELEALYQGDLGAAELESEALLALVRSNPDSAGLQCSTGELLIAGGHREEGLAAMHRAVALAPHDADFTCRLAGAYLATDAADDAFAVLTASRDHNDRRIVVALARLYESRGAWQQAADQYSKLINRQPDGSTWRLQRARCLTRIDASELAVADYESCWEADRAQLALADLIDYGGACLAVGDPTRAGRLFEEAARRGESSSELAALRAVCAYRQGYVQEAQQTIAAARAQWPQDATLIGLETEFAGSKIVPASATVITPAH